MAESVENMALAPAEGNPAEMPMAAPAAAPDATQEAAPSQTTAPDQNKTPETQKAAGATPAAWEQDPHLKELHDNRHKKKGARAIFHLVNFGGIHFIANSTLSLFLTYNLLPTKYAKSAMSGVAKVFGPISAGIDAVTLPIKKGWIHLKSGGKETFKALSKEERLFDLEHSARSRVETAFMCIAGCVALFPVKWLEDHRAGFISKVDNFLHPGRSPEEKKAARLKTADEPKETWTNLIRARIVGLTAVFAADAAQQSWTNARHRQGKWSFDTITWEWGAKLYDKMNVKLRTKFVDFFANHKVNLKSLQPMVRTDLLKTIKSPMEVMQHNEEINAIQNQMKTVSKEMRPTLEKQIDNLKDAFDHSHPHLKPDLERAVFAEQSRLLLTKEIWLTLLCATFIYASAKAPFMSRLFEKLHLKAKENPKQDTAAPAASEAPKDTASTDSQEKDKGSFAAAVGQRKAMAEPAAAYTDKVLSQSDAQPQVAI